MGLAGTVGNKVLRVVFLSLYGDNGDIVVSPSETAEIFDFGGSFGKYKHRPALTPAAVSSAQSITSSFRMNGLAPYLFTE